MRSSTTRTCRTNEQLSAVLRGVAPRAGVVPLLVTPTGAGRRGAQSARAVGCEGREREDGFDIRSGVRSETGAASNLVGGGWGCPLRERPQPAPLPGGAVQRAARRSCRRELPKRIPAPD